MKKIVFVVLGWALLWFAWTPATAQQTRTPITGSLTSGPIDSQFYYLNRISRTQDGMKLIRRPNLDLIQKNITDSLNSFRQELGAKKDSIAGLSTEVRRLNDSIGQVRQQLATAEAKGETISLLGMEFKTGLYQTIVWLIILGLVIFLIILMASMRRNSVITKEARNNLNDLQNEFDLHRKKSLEKEQKLMRRLQDELNKRNS